MKVIGLTGGSGSGKSTVAAMLQEAGAQVIDSDRVGHEAYRPGSEGWHEVVAAFGQTVVGAGGEIDRSRLAEIVFNDDRALQRLNAIVYPRIKAVLTRRLEELCQAGTEVVVVEAAVLIEAGWRELVDEVWLVEVPKKVAIGRLVRAGLSRQMAEARLRSQLSNEEKRRHAHVVIDNSGTLDELQQRIHELWGELNRREPGIENAAMLLECR